MTSSRSIGTNADDVFRLQATFVHASGRDPDVPFGVPDGNVSSGRRGQPGSVDAGDDFDDLVRRMLQASIEFLHTARAQSRSFSFIFSQTPTGRQCRLSVETS